LIDSFANVRRKLPRSGYACCNSKSCCQKVFGQALAVIIIITVAVVLTSHEATIGFEIGIENDAIVTKVSIMKEKEMMIETTRRRKRRRNAPHEKTVMALSDERGKNAMVEVNVENEDIEEKARREAREEIGVMTAIARGGAPPGACLTLVAKISYED
jgi:hypothetical protein